MFFQKLRMFFRKYRTFLSRAPCVFINSAVSRFHEFSVFSMISVSPNSFELSNLR
jgi:hypothetical protein